MRNELENPCFSRRAAPAEADRPQDQVDLLRAALTRRLRRDLAAPVRVDPRRHDRVTLMCGIEVKANRRTRGFTVRGRKGPDAGDWLYGRLKLNRPFAGPEWARAWWWCVRDGLPAGLRVLGDGMVSAALPQWINRAARHSGLLREARREAIAALRLNPRLLAWSRALASRGVPSTDHYTMVWHAVAAAKRRVREAPKLWPLYDVTGMAPTSELGRLKRLLVDHGLSRGGWKVLCRHGRQLWWPLRHCHEFGLAPQREVIFFANLMAATGRAELPPPGLLLVLGRLASVRRLDARHAAQLLRPVLAAWRALLWIDDPQARTTFLHGTVENVLCEWLLQPALPRVPSGAGWAWFVRWALQVREAERDRSEPWRGFGRCRRFGGLKVVPLRTLGAVRAAGRALRNCMATADPHDEARGPALFAIVGVDGRTRAMFSAYRDATRPREIRASCNRNADAEMLRIANEYVAYEHAKRAARALRHHGACR